MTRDQATDLITQAIVAQGDQQHILGAEAFAARLATSLDALGILEHLASLTLAHQATQRAADPLPTNQDEALAHIIEETEKYVANKTPPAWATKRDRS